MNFQDILTAVSTVGFPIVCCGALFWSNHQQNKQHDEEVVKFITAINDNKLAIQKLTDLIEETKNAKGN